MWARQNSICSGEIGNTSSASICVCRHYLGKMMPVFLLVGNITAWLPVVCPFATDLNEKKINHVNIFQIV